MNTYKIESTFDLIGEPFSQTREHRIVDSGSGFIIKDGFSSWDDASKYAAANHLTIV